MLTSKYVWGVRFEMNVKEFVIKVYKPIPYINNNSIFYCFAEEKLKEYVNLANSIDECNLSSIIDNVSSGYDFFLTTHSKRRLVNCISTIQGRFLEILENCYKGNFFKAYNILCKSLFSTTILARYIVEPYYNYISFRPSLVKRTFYRMRDSNDIVDNCFHVPFECRYNVSTNRYSLPGIPALYLADSKKTADAELGILEKEYRFVSKFTLKRSIHLYDLQVPSQKQIEQYDDCDILRKIILYPLILLCTTRSSITDNKFKEEYFISQLFSHLIFDNNNKYTQGLKYDGIIYSSTKNDKGYNIFIPMKYASQKPPQKGYSEMLNDLFNITKPELYLKK